MFILELRRLHAQERSSFLSSWRIEREAMAARHHDRLQQSRLVNADPIARSAALIGNARELTEFALEYLRQWTEMEDRHAKEIAALFDQNHF